MEDIRDSTFFSPLYYYSSFRIKPAVFVFLSPFALSFIVCISVIAGWSPFRLIALVPNYYLASYSGALTSTVRSLSNLIPVGLLER